MQPTKDLVLGGRYTLTERIAFGGMGEVWMAHDTVLRRGVAVKILKPELLGSAEFVERFRAEARHSAALTNVGIASVFDYGEDESGAFLVMEFVPGEALSGVLARTPVPPLAMTLSVLAQTAQALAAAHAGGVIHRDVKPGNLMILPDGSVKVTDFGIARAIDAAPLTVTGQVVGTPQYMSPEQASGQQITPSTDLYSLGVIGFEMLAGRRPFSGESSLAIALAQVNEPPPPLPATVPMAVRQLIERLLSKRPVDRPASAAALAAEIRRLQLSTTPPPGALLAGDAELFAATQVSGDAATAAMPVGAWKVSAPRGPVVVAASAAVPVGHRRAAILVGITAAAVVLAALLMVNRSDRPFFPAAASGTSGAPMTTVALTVAPTEQPTTTSTARVAETTTQPPPTDAPILVDPQLYIGRPPDEVVADLQALGLVAEVRSVNSKGRHSGNVVSVEPSGLLAPQTTVVVYVDRKNDD